MNDDSMSGQDTQISPLGQLGFYLQ